MSLAPNIYKILENIVGPENISDREYIMAAYRHQSPGASGREKAPGPAAVVLPSTVEQLQAIIKACNQNNIKYASLVSLFAATRIIQAGTVLLNLEKMNRIIEINEADRYAVIEPGVRHVQLKPELMKWD